MTGLDTETHRGRIVLIATPRNDLELWRYKPGQQWHVLIEWLRMQDTRFCCWNADYDIQAALKLLDLFTNETIMRRTSASYGRYRIRFVPSKFLRVGVVHGKQIKTLFTIYDLCQFYASSLEKAASKILGESKTNPGVEWGKLLEALRRGDAKAQAIRDYCRNDASLCERLYTHSQRAMKAAGVNFDKPISCASIAVQKFSKSMTHEVPRYINNAFEETYRGGRIECLKVGYFPRAYLYDIHSAYPSAMASLPSTAGQWLPIEKSPRPDAVYAALQVTLRVPLSEYRCPIPVKGESQLMYPTGQWSQWVDLDTFRLLEESDMIRKVRRGFQLVVTDGIKRPFAELAEMYQERQRQPLSSWALKIIMNALYGKVAERIGKWFPTMFVNRESEAWRGNFWARKEQWTKRTNFVYASAITSQIRQRLYRELDASKVVFYATDGVMTTEPLRQLATGEGLGEWSPGELVFDLIVVGSGVYTYRATHCEKCKAIWTDNRTACPACGESCVHTKIRGFEVGLDLVTLLDRRRRVLTLNVRRNWTLAQVIRQRKYAMFNELVDVPRYLDVMFDKKRIWEKSRTGRDLLKRSFESRPWAHYPDVGWKEF